MRRFARPVFITILAAAIVLGVAMFASSRVSRGGIETYQAPVFVHVRNNVPEANDALRVASANQGVPKTALLAPMPPPHSARQNMPATQIARTGTVSLLVTSVDQAVSAVTALTQQESG